MLTSVGSQSSDAKMSFLTVPGPDDARPADEQRCAHAAFPGAQLAALERRGAAVREGDGLGAVVGGEDDDRVVELAHVLELLQHDADVVVHLLHAGFVEAPVLAAGLADHASVLSGQHGRDVHARRVVPGEERLVGLLRIVAVEEVDDLGRDLLVDRLRPIQRQRAFVLARLVRRQCRRRSVHDSTGRGGVRQTDVSRIHRAGNRGKTRDRRVHARRRDGLLRSGSC